MSRLERLRLALIFSLLLGCAAGGLSGLPTAASLGPVQGPGARASTP